MIPGGLDAAILEDLRGDMCRTWLLGKRLGQPTATVRRHLIRLEAAGKVRRSERYNFAKDIMWELVPEAELTDGQVSCLKAGRHQVGYVMYAEVQREIAESLKVLGFSRIEDLGPFGVVFTTDEGWSAALRATSTPRAKVKP